MARFPIAAPSACLALAIALLPLGSARFAVAQNAVQKPLRPALSPEQQAIQAGSEADQKQMLEQLHIVALRPGKNGSDPTRPDFANYDESKANLIQPIPDPLVLRDGKKVTSPKLWWEKRRPEIVALFDEEVYGKVPAHTPKVSWEVVSTENEKNGDYDVVTKKLVGHVDNSLDPQIKVDISLTLSTPAHAKGPVPIVMQFSFDPAVMAAMRKRMEAAGTKFPPTPPGPDWKQQLLAKGWGYAELIPTTVQADNGAGLREGIIGLCNKGQYRKPDDWGALKAWAWGASRALDYFETDKSVDARQVGITGHSRYGKASLVTMAYDRRFAIAYISSSGMGGAALYRRNWGEPLENVASPSEYHWMAGNFLKYAGPLHQQDLPVDSNELIALCAPRPVFIGAGATNGPSGQPPDGDGWADAKGMFLAEVAAGPVYKLLGKKDLESPVFPPIETPLIAGDLGFRQHTGGHTPAPNWPTFMDFASHYFHATGEASAGE